MSVILNWLIDFVFPKFCVVCELEGRMLCVTCKESLPGALSVCPMCTRPSIFGLTHEACVRRLGMEGLIAVFDYKNEAVEKIVEAVKFGFTKELVAEVLSGFKLPKTWRRMRFVPVPLHRYRENWRGFNQAELIIKALGVVGVAALTRMRKTSQQARSMNKKERRENVKDAFKVTGMVNELRGKKIVLVDDVFTSGATMRECAKELKKAGVKEVWGFVLAR